MAHPRLTGSKPKTRCYLSLPDYLSRSLDSLLRCVGSLLDCLYYLLGCQNFYLAVTVCSPLVWPMSFLLFRSRDNLFGCIYCYCGVYTFYIHSCLDFLSMCIESVLLTSVARCGVFTSNWLFFNAYGGEKIVFGVVAGFWLFLIWPLGRNGGIYGIKALTKSATVE